MGRSERASYSHADWVAKLGCAPPSDYRGCLRSPLRVQQQPWAPLYALGVRRVRIQREHHSRVQPPVGHMDGDWLRMYQLQGMRATWSLGTVGATTPFSSPITS